MNTANLKKYGPQARRDFIEAVRDRAAYYGLTADEVLPLKVDGEAAIVGDRHFPANIAGKRKKLEERIKVEGFDRVMDAIAYTWFNRLVAIRYMELHGYLDHGYRVLSHPEGDANPEILGHAEHLDLPGLGNDTVVNLKLAGDKDAELYRLLLIAQCNALSNAMPFLFERIDDESELLLPENLLKSDSLVRRLVIAIPAEEWEDTEVIGWLYQFYISEKKDEVIGKVVKPEDIPAATQLFTPNWIVKYMVQNSLGAQWLATYPNSNLRDQMEFYIEPAEQTDEAKEQLSSITPTSLNPEEMTLIDPACGSGHILVEAYDLFKAIYLERGYSRRDVPRLILERNLFGLDIDERAVQLTGLALMMRARFDDRKLFGTNVRLNIVALRESKSLVLDAICREQQLVEFGLQSDDLSEIKELFEHATTFGSLIEVPENLVAKIPNLREFCETPSDDLFTRVGLAQLAALVRQSEVLAGRYDAVVANPPYMGAKYLPRALRDYCATSFPSSKSDLFSASIERYLRFASPTGRIGLMSPFTWMFLKSHEALRKILIDDKTLCSLIQPEYHAFFESAYVPIATFVVQSTHISDYNASFIKLSEFYGETLQPVKAVEAIGNPSCDWFYNARPDAFRRIPSSIIGYTLSDNALKLFNEERPLRDFFTPRQGLITGDNERFLRFWHEVDLDSFSRPGEEQEARWFAYQKGGPYRRWYGNHTYVVDWRDDGQTIKNFTDSKGKLRSRPQNLQYFFREGASWTSVTVGAFALRYVPEGSIFDQKGPMCFPVEHQSIEELLAFGNSTVMQRLLTEISPTIDFSQGPVGSIPFLQAAPDEAAGLATAAVAIARRDWDSYETSWDFQVFPVLASSSVSAPTIRDCYQSWLSENDKATGELRHLDEKNNRLYVDAYGLQQELSAEVALKEVTLTVNPAYRYGGDLSNEERQSRFRQDTVKELVSYAIGCMMGRYSLDEPGIIYAHIGNAGFDATRYAKFSADDDGIIPLTDAEWFDDDATHCLEEFLSVAWDKEHLEANLTFLANNLSPKKGDSSRATVRRYMSQSFFKNHLKTYKKRPIYWLFSSGKNKALECLVYLHRYNEGSLSRMRTEYVIPLQGKVASRISQLSDDIGAATSTSHRKKLQKRHDVLVKQREELRTFDEKLRHYADQRIHLDLDDGVKVNYGKFGDLLANVKDITGKKPESI